MRKHAKKNTGSYSREKKAEAADRYGQFAAGRRLTADIIAGRRIGAVPDA